MYKPKLISGVEACGVVTDVGPGLTGRQVGDLVAYAGQQMGSYAEEQILPANRAVPVPPSIDPKVAASLMLKGTTAQFLLRRCFKVVLHMYPHLLFLISLENKCGIAECFCRALCFIHTLFLSS